MSEQELHSILDEIKNKGKNPNLELDALNEINFDFNSASETTITRKSNATENRTRRQLFSQRKKLA